MEAEFITTRFTVSSDHPFDEVVTRLTTPLGTRDGDRLRELSNIHRRRLVTFAVASASNAPRSPRAPRTDVVFLFAALGS